LRWPLLNFLKVVYVEIPRDSSDLATAKEDHIVDNSIATELDVAQAVPSRLRWLGPYEILRGNRNLSLLFSGQVVSSIGDWLYISALVIMVYQFTGSATIAAALTATRLLPYALFLPISGVFADRFDRRRMMITADVGRAVCMLVLFLSLSERTVWLAFPMVFISTCLASLFRPALGATVPVVSGSGEKLVKANALMSQIDGLSVVVGPGLAGLLILVGIAREAFAINAVTYAVSALTLMNLCLPERLEREESDSVSWLSDTLTGFRFLGRSRDGILAAVTATTASIAVFNGALWTLAVVLSEQTWHFGSQGAGFLTAVVGAGGLVGGFAVAIFGGRLRQPLSYIVPVTCAALMMVVFGLCPADLLPFVSLLLFGVFDVFNQVDSNTIIQTSTPEAMLGRVYGAFEASMVGTVMLGALATGPMIVIVGARCTSILLGLVTFGILLISLPSLRRLGTREPVQMCAEETIRALTQPASSPVAVSS
jgi:MFS family permease